MNTGVNIQKNVLSKVDVYDIYSSSNTIEELAVEYDITTDQVKEIKEDPTEYMLKYLSKCKPSDLSRLEIRQIFQTGPSVSDRDLAYKYRTTVLSIKEIRRGKRYRRITRDIDSPLIGSSGRVDNWYRRKMKCASGEENGR